MSSTITETTDGITEWADKNRNLPLNVGYQLFDLNSVFERKRKVFVRGGHSCGDANAWDHRCVASKTLPLANKSNVSKWPPGKWAKSAKTNYRNLSLTSKYSFRTTSGHQVKFCKFCQHNVNFICLDTHKDHKWSKAHVKYITAQTLSISKNSVK